MSPKLSGLKLEGKRPPSTRAAARKASEEIAKKQPSSEKVVVKPLKSTTMKADKPFNNKKTEVANEEKPKHDDKNEETAAEDEKDASLKGEETWNLESGEKKIQNTSANTVGKKSIGDKTGEAAEHDAVKGPSMGTADWYKERNIQLLIDGLKELTISTSKVVRSVERIETILGSAVIGTHDGQLDGGEKSEKTVAETSAGTMPEVTSDSDVEMKEPSEMFDISMERDSGNFTNEDFESHVSTADIAHVDQKGSKTSKKNDADEAGSSSSDGNNSSKDGGHYKGYWKNDWYDKWEWKNDWRDDWK